MKVFILEVMKVEKSYKVGYWIQFWKFWKLPNNNKKMITIIFLITTRIDNPQIYVKVNSGLGFLSSNSTFHFINFKKMNMKVFLVKKILNLFSKVLTKCTNYLT